MATAEAVQDGLASLEHRDVDESANVEADFRAATLHHAKSCEIFTRLEQACPALMHACTPLVIPMWTNALLRCASLQLLQEHKAPRTVPVPAKPQILPSSPYSIAKARAAQAAKDNGLPEDEVSEGVIASARETRFWH